ncbi:hypothetical protein H8356DRAFT_1416928 [Neocallimastix lanati (nom. inval.)]|nr:hypothetical protein H8356DRAFT_1416928 [Neocallimastix sp. JGI-2020a]
MSSPLEALVLLNLSYYTFNLPFYRWNIHLCRILALGIISVKRVTDPTKNGQCLHSLPPPRKKISISKKYFIHVIHRKDSKLQKPIIKNKMTFEIRKWATLAALIKYSHLGILFNKSLKLKPINTKMNNKNKLYWKVSSCKKWSLIQVLLRLDQLNTRSLNLNQKVAQHVALVAVIKSLNIPNVKKEDFDDNINFYIGSEGVGKKAESLLSRFNILYFVGLVEFLTNAMPIVISKFFTLINLYTIRPNPLLRAQRRNSDIDSNDNFYSHGVNINEWEEFEAIFSFLP